MLPLLFFLPALLALIAVLVQRFDFLLMVSALNGQQHILATASRLSLARPQEMLYGSTERPFSRPTAYRRASIYSCGRGIAGTLFLLGLD